MSLLVKVLIHSCKSAIEGKYKRRRAKVQSTGARTAVVGSAALSSALALQLGELWFSQFRLGVTPSCVSGRATNNRSIAASLVRILSQLLSGKYLFLRIMFTAHTGDLPHVLPGPQYAECTPQPHIDLGYFKHIPPEVK